MAKREHFQRFESLTEFADFAVKHVNKARESYTNPTNAWTGDASFEGAVRLSRQGWPEGAAKAAKLATRLAGRIGGRVLHFEPHMTVEGGSELDIGAFNAGVPECWIDTQPEYRPAMGGVVDVVCSMSISGSQSGDSLIRRGAMVAALVQTLELAGRSGRVTVANSTSDNIGTYHSVVVVKRAGEVLDPGVLAFALAHPAMLRRLSFASMDYARTLGFTMACYGTPKDLPESERGDIYVPKILAGEQKSEDWILEQLRSVGVEISEAGAAA
jgi:hypothetical protein